MAFLDARISTTNRKPSSVHGALATLQPKTAGIAVSLGECDPEFFVLRSYTKAERHNMPEYEVAILFFFENERLAKRVICEGGYFGFKDDERNAIAKQSDREWNRCSFAK
jgi:hypothetical protein